MGWLWAFAWVPLVMFVGWRVKRRLRYLHRYGYYGRHPHFHGHHHGFRGFHGEHGAEFGDDEPCFVHALRGGRGFGRRRRGRILFGLFRQIDASPGQEKAILKLVDELAAKLGDARADFLASRRDLAAALEKEEIDSAALDAVFLRNTELFVSLSRELQSALVSAHQALDSDQRKALAQLIAHGFGGRPSYAPHPAYAL